MSGCFLIAFLLAILLQKTKKINQDSSLFLKLAEKHPFVIFYYLIQVHTYQYFLLDPWGNW